jgi:hypothetical protein
MNEKKRSIINVGVGFWYPKGQARLVRSLAGKSQADVVTWNCWPEGSPAHSEMPFAFKSHAFRRAREAGYRRLLWLDCSCWAVKSLEPVWEKIERDGFLLMNNGWHLGQWASDYCLEFFGKTRDEAMQMIDLTAMMMGFDLDNPKAAAWMAEFEECCKNPRLMNGSLHNVPGQEIVDPHSGVNVGVISSDIRCLGHSREQVTAGFLAYKHGLLPYSNSPEYLIQGWNKPADHPVPDEAIVLSCGM